MKALCRLWSAASRKSLTALNRSLTSWKNITPVGGNGDGQTCKVANQIIVALNIEAVSEALVFASKAGADPVRVPGVNGRVRLFTHSGSSRRADDQPDVRAGFKIALHQKDLNLALQSAKALALNLPNTATCRNYSIPVRQMAGASLIIRQWYRRWN